MLALVVALLAALRSTIRSTCRTRRGDPGPAASTRRASSPGATSAPPVSHRPTPLGLAVSGVIRMAARGADRLTGHGRPLAPAGLRPVLALEVTTPRPRAAGNRRRHPQTIRADAGRESTLGRAAHPRRAAEARHRDLPGDGLEVPGPPSRRGRPRPGGRFSQPRGRARVRRLLHRAHRDLPRALRVRGPGSRPAARSSTSTSPPTRPPSGRPSSSSRRSRGTPPRASSSATATASTARRSAARTNAWASRRSSPPLGRPGRIRSSNASSAPSAASASTTSSSGTNAVCAATSGGTSPTTTTWRPHLSLDKDAPIPRAMQPPSAGRIVQIPEVGGLHHHYERRAA